MRFQTNVGVCLVGLALLTAGCGKHAPAVDRDAGPRLILVSPPRPPPELREAVVNALQERGWAVEQENANLIVANVNHKGTTVHATFTSVPDQISVQVLDAQGPGAEKYIANVENSIRANLHRPEPPPVKPAALVPPPTVAVFGKALNEVQARDTLQRALAEHNWVIEQLQPNGMLARLVHHKTTVRVQIIANPSDASIVYVSSDGLDIDATGHSAEYERWMRLLVDAIRSKAY